MSSVPVRPATTASSLVAMGGLVLIWVLQDWATFIHGYKDSLITPWNPGTSAAVIARSHFTINVELTASTRTGV